MKILSIESVQRCPQTDIYFTPDECGELVESRRERAPIEAVYEITFGDDQQNFSFDAEVRVNGKGHLQIDWDDGLSDMMVDNTLPPSAWKTLNELIFVIHQGGTVVLPRDLN